MGPLTKCGSLKIKTDLLLRKRSQSTRKVLNSIFNSKDPVAALKGYSIISKFYKTMCKRKSINMSDGVQRLAYATSVLSMTMHQLTKAKLFWTFCTPNALNGYHTQHILQL